ncbi:MAG: Hsp20/alpha crystallin family protein, partial [Planctomycetota bacterium]
EEKKDYYRVESRYGKFSRKVRLPEEIDSDKIKASFENGVLKIRIAKAEKVKPKAITIETH